MKTPLRYEIKGLLIAAAAMAALILAVTWKNSLDNRLPKDPGITVYYNTLDADGQYYEKLSRGGTAIGWNWNYDGGIWLSEQDYINNNSSFLLEKGEPAQPLSVWREANDRAWLSRILVDGSETVCFAVKTRDSAKVKAVSVFRWPLEMIGTEAVKENSWTGREKVGYVWNEGALFSLSKGEIALEPGYLYSIFVEWTANGQISRGWEEYSFVTMSPEQAGVTVRFPD